MKKLKFLLVMLLAATPLSSDILHNGKQYVERNMPLILHGKDTLYVVTAGEIEFINNWWTNRVTVNGKDYTNKYSTRVPSKIGGMYFIEYLPKNSKSRLEILGVTSWDDTVGVALEEPEIDTVINYTEYMVGFDSVMYRYAIKNDKIYINWKVSRLENDCIFWIQKQDGNVHGWYAVNSVTPVSFTFIDENIHGGQNIYQMYKEDNGVFFPLFNLNINTTKVRKTENLYVNMYPNPTNAELSIEITETYPGKREIKIYNLLGQRVKSIFYNTYVGKNIINLNLCDVRSSTYFVVVDNILIKKITVLK